MNQPNSNQKRAGYAVSAFGFLLLLGGLSFWFASGDRSQTVNEPATVPSTVQATNQQGSDRAIAQSQETDINTSLEPAASWQQNNHVHGLAVNPDNPQIVYLATHDGLVKRAETGEWFWMQPENERADYMGFTAHPTDSMRFYASGHPHTGGNLGFQVTGDRGKSWEQVSMPGVDFHAMAIAPSNPDVFYAWPASGAQGFHVSKDGGKTWSKPQMEGLGGAPFSLGVDPNNPDRVFATTGVGLYESTNSGDDWTRVPNTQDGPVVGLALLKQGDSTLMYGYRLLESEPGIYRSADGGNTWEPLGTGTEGVILYLAIAPSNPQIIYAVNENTAIFQSQDGGKTWQELV